MVDWRMLSRALYRFISAFLWRVLDIPFLAYRVVYWSPSRQSRRACALLHSFDGYKRFWAASLYFSRLYLPPSLPFYCASEHCAMLPSSHFSLLTGSGNFVWRLIIALHHLRRSYRFVLYLQEDMWLDHPLDSRVWHSWVNLMIAHRLDCLKLSVDSVPPESRSLLPSQPPLDPVAGSGFTWYGPHHFLMSHHGSLFCVDYLLKSLVFAYILGARKPKEHEILVSRAFRSISVPPLGSPRVACWRQQPPLSYVHASDAGELTAEAVSLLRSNPSSPPVNENLPGEVFPARSVRKV